MLTTLRTIKPLLTLLALIIPVLPMQAQESMPPALYVGAGDIIAALEKSAQERPGMGAGLIANSDHYRINLIRRTEAAGAIVHVPGTELHYILDGAGTLVTGGTVVRPEGGGPGRIEGGLARQVSKGDAILIPEGTPHQYTAVEGFVSYLEVRFNVPVE